MNALVQCDRNVVLRTRRNFAFLPRHLDGVQISNTQCVLDVSGHLASPSKHWKKAMERKWLYVLATLGALEEVSIDKWLSLQDHEGLITKSTQQDSVEDTRLTVLDYLLYHELPQYFRHERLTASDLLVNSFYMPTYAVRLTVAGLYRKPFALICWYT